MPIQPFLDGENFDPETTRVLGVAFELTCIGLRTGVAFGAPTPYHVLAAKHAWEGVTIFHFFQKYNSRRTGTCDPSHARDRAR